ncbi:MAG: hypothetical protein AAGF24_00335 [Cyanobacteria bacterium P01_H01_bin.121]
MADSFYVGGIQVNEPDQQTWVRGLKQADMNTVAVTVYAMQGDWDSDNLWFDAQNEGVVAEIRAAKEAGLKVSLILRVALDHAFERNAFLWHGLIMPNTDADLESWFTKYSEFVTKWAAIAEAEGVDMLGVGSELNLLTSTQPLDALPGLERYYLDDEDQAARIQELLQNADQVPPEQLWTWGDRRFDTLDAYLQSELTAWQAWAEQVSWQATPDPVASINTRRLRLEHHWRRLIRQTRELYSGRLTYAANFDQYQQVAFWDALDYMGINAYFSLRDREPQATKAQTVAQEGEALAPASLSAKLEAGWRAALGDIQAFREAEVITDKPVVFTELGYTRWLNSTVEPWSYSGFSLFEADTTDDTTDGTTDDTAEVVVWQEQPLNIQERVAAIQALNTVLQNEYPGLLQGILYWKLSTLPEHTEIEPFVLVLNQADPLQDALAELRELLPR